MFLSLVQNQIVFFVVSAGKTKNTVESINESINRLPIWVYGKLNNLIKGVQIVSSAMEE